MKKNICLCLAFILGMKGLYAQDKTYTSLKDAAWLQGSWKGTYKNAPFYEAWHLINDSVMVNFRIQLQGADTVVKEGGVIRLRQGVITHDGDGASWKLTQFTPDSLVFENDTLKFANRIAWSHDKNDHWLTVINNPRNTITYDLHRVPGLDAAVRRFMQQGKKQ